MRSAAIYIAGVCAACALGATDVRAAVLQNPDFESGTLAGWTAVPNQLTINTSTNTTFNRNYAARISGKHSGSGWITNTLSQTVPISGGDSIKAVGFIYWKDYAEQTAGADGRVEVSLTGPGTPATAVWASTNKGWVYYDLSASLGGIVDGGFEAGTLAAWTVGADNLSVQLDSQVVRDGNGSLHISGSWTNGWSFNQAFQLAQFVKGDVVQMSGDIRIDQLQTTGGNGFAGIKLEMEGTTNQWELSFNPNTNTTGWVHVQKNISIPTNGSYVFRCMAGGNASNGPNQVNAYFDNVKLWKKPVTVEDGGFELGPQTFNGWTVGADALKVTNATAPVFAGTNSLRMSGAWSGWSWNQAYQVIGARSGDVIEARGKIYIQDLEATAGWTATGIKLESEDGRSSFGSEYNQNSTEGSWLDLSITANITNSGVYVFRAMTCGDVSGGTATGTVFFDNLQIWRQNEPTGEVADATLALKYIGYSGGTQYTNSVDVYMDSVMLEGSTANLQPATNIYAQLMNSAGVIASNPSETDLPPLDYPPLGAYGNPGYNTNVNYGTYTEAAFASWRFRHFTNNITLTVTNVLLTYGLGAYGPGYCEIDQYRYCARNWGTQRGAPLDILTNAPYFTIGTDNNSSAEFGNGPFPAIHTYVVGTPLTNFPKRIDTDARNGWPKIVNIVFPENFAQYDRAYDKYFTIDLVGTNGQASNVKTVQTAMQFTDPMSTNFNSVSIELHMGWAPPQDTWGMIEFPNCTYQGHNEVILRRSFEYGLVDGQGWFMQQVARGGATVEPLDIYTMKNGNWNFKAYEEYLFTWPNAASGVRSIFEDDNTDRLPGPASYAVGYKMGHQFGTNEFGEPLYPQLMEVRGNGYYRMSDYGSVMGGSFRPVSADLFGLYQNKEDAPLLVGAYSRLVPRTTPTNQPDNAYTEVFMPLRSKTNHWFTGVARMETHFAPDEATNSGAYFEMESDIYANKAVVLTNHGSLNAFAQVDMYWRGDSRINQTNEDHDFDVVMLKKANGEWVTHHPVNPPTNIVHRSLGRMDNGDAVYIMQQDRGVSTYAHKAESAYQRVSNFEITMLDTGGRNISLDMYEQNTISEINDNCCIAGGIRENIAKGERVHGKYRYRCIAAPGVVIRTPNESSGGESWSNNTYDIRFYATDWEGAPLEAFVYYGNGKDTNWTRINPGVQILVPNDTHEASCVWDVSSVPAGAYYIKVEARRVSGEGKWGFDVSDARLQVGNTRGLPHNGALVTVVTTNTVERGTNMSFEAGSTAGWTTTADNLNIAASQSQSVQGVYSARMAGNWAGWSWNCLTQPMTCLTGEALRVTGKVFIRNLAMGSTNWVRCGIKMESTNVVGRTDTGMEFQVASGTGVWLNVDFTRIAPVTGKDNLLLWVAGTDCNAAEVYFDDIHVISPNGAVVTNYAYGAYWQSATPVNVSTQNTLSFYLAGTSGVQNVQVQAMDSTGGISFVYVTNFMRRITTLQQLVDIPWTNFTTVNRAQLTSIGFLPASVEVSRMRSVAVPLRVRSITTGAPLNDPEGLSLFNPGQTVTNIITIENISGAALTGITVQAVQEYGEETWWLDQSPHVPAQLSEKTRRGDRLAGTFEQLWTNQALAAGATITITNVYTSPVGLKIDYQKFAIKSSAADWYVFRNWQARGQTRLVLRKANGDNVFDGDMASAYSMDDDNDFDNDGMSDAYEIQYAGSLTSLAPGADLDNDGYTNLQESQWGTDPSNAGSFPGSVNSMVGRRGTIHNSSYDTLCAEVDNINVPIVASNVTAYRITATTPKYFETSLNETGGDGTDCTFGDAVIWRIGNEDWLGNEFRQSGFTNGDLYYATDNPGAGIDEPVGSMPKEINNDWLYDQQIAFTADESGDANIELGIGAVLNVRMALISGTLDIEALTKTTNGWVSRGRQVFTSSNMSGWWTIPDHTWTAGTDTNFIKFHVVRAFEGGSTTTNAWAIYDYLKLEKRAGLGDNQANPTVLYGDTNVEVNTVWMDYWWRNPRAMTVSVIGGGTDTNAQFVRIKQRKAVAQPPYYWDEVFVMYEDGNARIIPLPPGTNTWIPYGASVILGPSTNSIRPYCGINSVTIDPKDLSMDIQYQDGGSAHVELHVDNQANVVDVSDITYPTTNRSLACFRSMWVRDGKADVDRVQTEEGIFPIMDSWAHLGGSWWQFFKDVPSYHNTYCPDFRFELMGTNQGFLVREAESYNSVSGGTIVTGRSKAYGNRTVAMSTNGGEVAYTITLTNEALATSLRLRFSDVDAGNNRDILGNSVRFVLDGVTNAATVYSVATGGSNEFEILPSLYLGDLVPGSHEIRIQTGPGTGGLELDWFDLVSQPSRVRPPTSILTRQCEAPDRGTNYVVEYQQWAVNTQVVHLVETNTTDPNVAYNVYIPSNHGCVYMRLKYGDDVAPTKVTVMVDATPVAQFPSERTGWWMPGSGWWVYQDTPLLYLGAITGGWHEISIGAWRETYGVSLDEFELYYVEFGNRPPEISLKPSYTFAVGYSSNFTVVATDPDVDTLTLTKPVSPTNSTLANSVFTWAPPSSACGTTTLVVFAADDGRGLTNSTATNSTYVIVPTDWDGDGINDRLEWDSFGTLTNSAMTNFPPVASNLSVNATEDVARAITLVAVDPETNAMTYIITSNPTNGTLAGTPPNLTYTSFTNKSGADSFTFRAKDGSLTGNVATVSITIAAVNDAPVAHNKGVNVVMNTAKAISLTATDVESTNLMLAIVANPTKGVLSGTPPNVTYTPSNNYTGVDSFTFRASDGALTSGVATVSLTIAASNQVATYERHINCGGGPYTSVEGYCFERDMKYTAIHGAGYLAGGQATVTGGTVTAAYDPGLLMTERYGINQYRFDVPNGIYTVQMRFAETWFTGPGQRKFNVYLEGTQVLTQLDVYATVGGYKELITTFSGIAVADNQLNITFSNVVDSANIRAISVFGGSGAAGVTTPATVIATGKPFRTKLSWSPCPDADRWGYHVERADASTGTFVRVNPSLICTTNFDDVNVNNNRQYYYRVLAVDYSKNTSAPSAVVSATPRQVAMTRPFPPIPACAWRRPLGDVPPDSYERSTPDRGVALGGIGVASFMYSISGSFGPWDMNPGQSGYENSWLWEAAFHVYEKAASGTATALCLSTRSSPMVWPRIGVSNATYYALHPRGWVTYDGKFLNPISMQFFSPVLPNNYKESSYPVAVFDWTLTNSQAQTVDTSIMLTWPNKNFPGKTRIGWTNHLVSIPGGLKGMVLKAINPSNTPETQNSEWCIGTRDASNVVFSYVKSWNATGTGADVWNDFAADGVLTNGSLDNSDRAAAIAVKVTLAPGEVRSIPIVIAWDYPVVEFVGGAQWWKKYCEYFGRDSDNSPDIATEAVQQYTNWEQQIAAWQQPFVTNSVLPDWLKCAAFNELYYNQFGGIFWESGLKYHPSQHTEYMGLHVEDNKHFEQEAYEYENSTAVDVRHYSSIVYAKMWPKIEREFLVNVADAITFFDPTGLHQTPHNMGSTRSPFGIPGDPYFAFDCYQTYNLHWKDLPSRFIQQVYRYDKLQNDKGFLDYVWPSAKQTYEYLKSRDIDGDGLPDHLGDGVPDNTFDNWGGGLKGASTECGALWVGALEAMESMATKQGDPILTDVQAWLARARTNLESKLWFEEGGYYRSDSGSTLPKRDSIMADALSGDRYGQTYGLAPVANTNRMRTMFAQIYDRCVVPMPDVTGDGVGDAGAINGLMENGDLFDFSSQQPNEIWTGVSYVLAAMMERAGLHNEALQSAFGVYERCYENNVTAFWFNTPEGYRPDGTWVRPRNPEAYQRVRAIWELVQELAPTLFTNATLPAKRAEVNVALGCAVTASSAQPNGAAANCVDGNWTTRWSSAFTDTEWVSIDLGVPTDVTRVSLNWEAAYGSAYRIQGSSNGVNWVDLSVVTNGDGMNDSIAFSSPQRVRHVRMYGQQRATAWGYSLWEFEVYARNIAQSKAATSSTAVSNAPVTMARDGRLDTAWSSLAGTSAWYNLDLGSLGVVDAVTVVWGTNYAANYYIDFSTNGSAWVNAYTNSSGDGGVDHIALPATATTRYVRVTMPLASASGYQIQELQVMGNMVPVASNQSVTATEDTAKAITLVASDADCETLAYAVVANPAKGSLSGTPPSVTYTPFANTNGADSFTFRATDGRTTSAVATVSITITAVNDAPVANSQSVTTVQSVAKAIVLTATDIDSTNLTYAIAANPTNGALTGTPPNVTYTPSNNFYGADSFTFRAADGLLTSSVATVAITVNQGFPTSLVAYWQMNEAAWTGAVNEVIDSSVWTNHGRSYNGATTVASGKVSRAGTFDGTNDYVAVPNSASLQLASNLTLSFWVNPTNLLTKRSNPMDKSYGGEFALTFETNRSLTYYHGTNQSAGAYWSWTAITAGNLTNGAWNHIAITRDAGTRAMACYLNGSLFSSTTYPTNAGNQPKPSTNVVRMGMGYTAEPFGGRLDEVRIYNNVQAATSILALAGAPIASNQSVNATEDVARAVTLAGSDPNGEAITYIVTANPTKGTLSGTAPNLTYTPFANTNGVDTFRFVTSDGIVKGATGVVTITMAAVNDAPVASNQSVNATEDVARVVVLTGSDVDSTGLTYSVVATPTNGALTGTPPNLTYTPSTNYYGADSFTFRIADGLLTSSVATVSLTVSGVNDAPVASNQSVNATEDVARVVVLTGGDIDSTSLTYSVVSSPTKGTLTGTPPSVTYTPSNNYNGADSFTFRVADGSLTSSVATVSITVASVNDTPVANAQAVATARNTAKALTLTGTDVETTGLVFVISSSSTHGSLSGTPPAVTYTPSNNYVGGDSFTFVASDGSLTSTPASVTITVTNVATTIYVDDSNSGTENGSQANPYNTIMEGVNVALAGDTVMVNTGVYGEMVMVLNKTNLTVRGASEQAMLTNGGWKVFMTNSVNCLVEGFTVTGGYGGVCISKCTGITLARSTIRNIAVSNFGGQAVIYGDTSSLQILDNSILSNYGGQAGGGGYYYNTHLRFESNDVIGCSAWAYAGGIYIYSSGATYTNRIRQNYFKSCTADYSGAIVLGAYGAGDASIIDHNTILGCGPDFQSGGAVQVNCLSGGATGPVRVVNNVIKDPYQPSNGTIIGLYVGTGKVYAANNVFQSGFAYAYSVVNNPNSPSNDVVVQYNDHYNFIYAPANVVYGTGNITNDPSFVNPAAEDFHLLTNSPCINSGDPAAIYNDADSSRNDMGVYGGNY